MILKTARLQIRPIAEQDWPQIKEIWEDFHKSEYAGYDMPHDTQDDAVRTRIARWASVSGTEHLFFAVCLHDSVIGYIACNQREIGYELGYCFHSAYHGNGYAKESHLAVFSYLRTLGATKVSAGTALENIPSVQLLRSLGFRQTGTEQVSFYQDTDGNRIIFDGGIFELDLAQR